VVVVLYLFGFSKNLFQYFVNSLLLSVLSAHFAYFLIVKASVKKIKIEALITARKKADEAIRHMAYHDRLTGLPNRLFVSELLEHALAMGHRHGSVVAVFSLDINRFKAINDTFGHAAGDEIIKAVAERLKRHFRETDTVAHPGGDEFTVLLQDINRVDDIAGIADNVVSIFKEPFNIDGHEFFLTVSMGISVYPDDGADPGTLLKNAEMAMHMAKDGGDTSCRFHNTAMNARTVEKFKFENKLRRAIEKNELLLHYQPQIEIKTGRVTGVEALIRWHCSECGKIHSPADFIPIAEETGLIVPIGEWVLRKACEENKKWQDKGLKPVRIAVNLSLKQFMRKDFVEKIAEILKNSILDPQYLELEITESIAMKDVEITITILRRLKNMGIRLAIDDFGTGYSSLAHLKQMPLDVLKIDRSFVKDITNNPDDATIALAVIRMAHALRLEVVAEGVEIVEQFDFFHDMQCNQIQGFLISRPVPSDELEGFLAEKQYFPAESAYASKGECQLPPAKAGGL